MSFPFKVIDLTHTLSPNTATWSGGCGFECEIKQDYGTSGFRVQQMRMHAGIGTHIDAPSHCIKEGKSVSDLHLEDLIAPCAMVDISHKATASYSLSIEDLMAFEQHNGTISVGTFIIVHTGWEKFWSHPDAYRNNYVFPSISKSAAQLLLDRGITGIGIDTLSPDRPEDGFEVHKILLGEGKYIVENVANAINMPPVGGYSLCLPIKAKDATEAPTRLLGLISR